MCNATMIKKPQ